MLREAWGSTIAAAPAYSAAMASVWLPGTQGADRAAARLFGRHLTEQHDITANVMALDGSLWLRVSAQIYNEIDDYRLLAEIAPRVLRELGV
jgi:isopenicillin-N epimerase